MSKPDTWMPFFIGDYRKDTTRLTTEQHGAYLLLILDYWTNGPPPADDAVLARITCLDRRAWLKAKPALAGFFRPVDGVWTHKRIDQELAGAVERSGKAAAKARTAALARWEADRERKEAATSSATSIEQARAKQSSCNALHLLPVTSLASEDKSSSAGARGGRLAEAWLPDPVDVAYAAKEGFNSAEILRMAESFRDYWRAQPGAKGRKADWPATWRGWVRREADRQSTSPRRKRVGFV